MAKNFVDDWKWKIVETGVSFAYKSFLMVMLANMVYRTATWFGMDHVSAAIGTMSAMLFTFHEGLLESRDKHNALLLGRIEEWRDELRRDRWNR